MKLKLIVVATLAGLLAVSGCKKDKKGEPAAGSGTAAAGSGMAGGGDTAGSSTIPTGSGMAGGSSTGSGAITTGSGMAGGPVVKMTDAEIEGVINSMIAIFEDIAKAVDGKKDCKGMADGITTVLDANKAFFDKFASIADDKDIEDRAEKIMEDKGLEKKLEAAGEKGLGMVEEKCKDDPDVAKAMERLKAIK